MKLWSKANHPHFNQRKTQLKNQIEIMRASPNTSDNPRLLELQNNLVNLLLQEDVYWRQCSKIYWLKDGDTNNKFFHCTASSRHRKNTITKLRHPNGSWLTSQEDMIAHIYDYFSNLFHAIQGDQQPVIARIQPRVTGDDNTILTKPFTAEEFKEAIFSMHPDKSSGPDWLNLGFY